MKVILSTDLEDNYTNFVVVKDFKSVEPDVIDVLIIHKFAESDFDAGVAITDLADKGLRHFIYINENPSLVIKTAIIGVEGSIYTDEFYFEDEDELLELLAEEGLNEESNSLALTSAQVVKDFIKAFSRKEKRIEAPLYLEQVNQAINELGEITHKQELQITQMGESAIDVFKRASEVINSMEDSKRLLQKQLDEFEEKISVQSSKPSSFGGGSILFYPTFKYTGVTTKVLLIKEYSPCRYLTSLLLAYTHYLHYEKNKKVKLVFTYQKGKNIQSKYSAFTTITQESMNVESLYQNEVVGTNNPKQDVMKRLTNQNDDILIVLDRLYGQPIIAGRITSLNAVSGASDVNRFKLKPENTIFPITGQPTEFFHIPLIKNYARDKDMRIAAYAQVCKEHFHKLDALVLNK